jgi:phage shock protein C
MIEAMMNTTQARLTRSSTDKILGGVCGGLGNYFGIDPVIVRLIFVGLVFAGGMSIVLYPVLWLIMPVAAGDQPTISAGLQDMQQVAHQVRAQAGEGADALRSRVEAAFSHDAARPRFDPQTGEPLQPATANRNSLLGMVLIGVGVLVLASLFPGGSSAMMALFFLAGGYYLLRRSNSQA